MTDQRDCGLCTQASMREDLLYCQAKQEYVNRTISDDCSIYEPIHLEDTNIEKFMDELKAVLDDDFNFLVEKNRQYGDSALDPLRIFSQASTKEQIFVRLDDKLSRIKRGDAKIEDTFRDMRGYLNLLEVLVRREERDKA